MRLFALVAVLGLDFAAHDARADNPVSVDPILVRERGSDDVADAGAHDADEVPPPLRFDRSLFRVGIGSFAEEKLPFELSPEAKLELTGSWRLPPDEFAGENDLVHSWNAGAAASYDLGWARVQAHATYGHEENELGRGREVDVGIAMTRTHRLSRNTIAFVSLSLGRTQWLGRPLPGEFNASRLMLTGGLRWR